MGGYARYHPSRGYWWDFGKEKEKEEKEKDKKEEPSSMFQRRRVDMLLDQLTRQFPHKVPQQPSAANALTEGESQVGAASETAASVKSEKIDVSSIKRERPGVSKPDSASKKIKVER